MAFRNFFPVLFNSISESRVPSISDVNKTFPFLSKIIKPKNSCELIFKNKSSRMSLTSLLFHPAPKFWKEIFSAMDFAFDVTFLSQILNILMERAKDICMATRKSCFTFFSTVFKQNHATTITAIKAPIDSPNEERSDPESPFHRRRL